MKPKKQHPITVTRIEITERDKKIILDCCKFKGLTKGYLAGKYFNGNVSVCHTRLYLLVKAGYLKKAQYLYEQKHTEERSKVGIKAPSALRRGNKRTYIYYVSTKGQKTVGYNLSARAARLSPNINELEKHILLSEICSCTEVMSASETRATYKIANIVPVLCSVSTPDKLVIIVYFSKQEKSAKSINSIKTFVETHAVTSSQPVVFTLVSHVFPQQLSSLDINYLPVKYTPGLLSNIAKDIDYYKKSFRQVFLDAGYSILPDNGLFWQVAKNGQTYNIAELITGSAKLTHALHDPPPGTYIFVNNISHLPKITASKTSFLVYADEDNTTYQVTYDSGSRKLEKISKGVVV